MLPVQGATVISVSIVFCLPFRILRLNKTRTSSSNLLDALCGVSETLWHRMRFYATVLHPLHGSACYVYL